MPQLAQLALPPLLLAPPPMPLASPVRKAPTLVQAPLLVQPALQALLETPAALPLLHALAHALLNLVSTAQLAPLHQMPRLSALSVHFALALLL